MPIIDEAINRVTESIIACAMAVHGVLGPGFLEAICEQCLQIELRARELTFKRNSTVPLVYRGIRINATYRFDFVVEDKVLIEVKSVQALAPVHRAQVINYLKLTGLPIGLLVNFNVPLLKDGMRRLEHPDLYLRRKHA
jgi:GxxExxY protein